MLKRWRNYPIWQCILIRFKTIYIFLLYIYLFLHVQVQVSFTYIQQLRGQRMEIIYYPKAYLEELDPKYWTKSSSLGRWQVLVLDNIFLKGTLTWDSYHLRCYNFSFIYIFSCLLMTCHQKYLPIIPNISW